MEGRKKGVDVKVSNSLQFNSKNPNFHSPRNRPPPLPQYSMPPEMAASSFNHFGIGHFVYLSRLWSQCSAQQVEWINQPTTFNNQSKSILHCRTKHHFPKLYSQQSLASIVNCVKAAIPSIHPDRQTDREEEEGQPQKWGKCPSVGRRRRGSIALPFEAIHSKPGIEGDNGADCCCACNHIPQKMWGCSSRV
jgi:hypothetical protein